MSTDEQATAVADQVEADADAAPAKPKLALEVEITDAGPCKKHLKVAIPRAEIDRQYGESLKEVKREAAVPGFRPGRAPNILVQKRFKKEVAGQVKQTLLMACLEQLDADYELNPIAQPKLDVEAIEIPDEGPLKFELDVEVEPEFKLPTYKALSVKRPTRVINDADVEAQMRVFLERYAQLVPKLEGGAEVGDQITADLKFHRNGTPLNEAKEVSFRLQPELRFQDGSVPELEKALKGVRPEETREAEALVGSSSPDPALRNQTIGVTFNVLDLKTYRLPTVDKEFLASIGFDTEAELSQALREVLERRVVFQQRQALRKAVMDQLVASTPFDLPPDLVARQERSTLVRQVGEMRQAGMADAEIRAREAELRANAHEQTLRSLQEFFLLSKIAEAEGVKVEDGDVEAEIDAIAAKTDESPRRVRARIEKEGLGESLATQILERKAIDRVLEYAMYEEVALEAERGVETLDESVAPEYVAPETVALEATAAEPTADAP